MKTVDLSPLLVNDKEYSELITSVSENYKCRWDDDVHESYAAYVKQMEKNKEALHVIRCRAETLVKELEGLNVDAMIKTADSLCEEARTV